MNKEKKINEDTEETEDNIDKSVILIKDALEYYDKACDKNKDKFIKINYISIDHNDKDLEHSIITLYDSNLKEISTHKYESIGVYDIKSQIWTWAWAIPILNKNETNIIRKILNYGTELDKTALSLKLELVTSRFIISNKTQLDIHCAIASYLSKKPNILSYRIFGSAKVIDNKYIDVLNPDTELKNTNNYDLLYYIFLLD
jgi:hypothetical protein